MLKSHRVWGEHYQTQWINQRLHWKSDLESVLAGGGFAAGVKGAWFARLRQTFMNDSFSSLSVMRPEPLKPVLNDLKWVFALQMIHAFCDHSRCSGNFHGVEAVADSQAIIEIWTRILSDCLFRRSAAVSLRLDGSDQTQAMLTELSLSCSLMSALV